MTPYRMEFEAVDMAGKGNLWGTICGLHQLGLEYAQAVRSAISTQGNVISAINPLQSRTFASHAPKGPRS